MTAISSECRTCDTGIIVRVSGGICWVLIGHETIPCAARGNVKKRQDGVAVGDSVRVTRDADGGIVEEILPRTTCLARPLIANVDQAVVVMAAAEPSPNLNLLDRILVLVEQASLHAVICVTKMDLAGPSGCADMMATYSDVGYQVMPTSVRTGQGITEVIAALANRISVFSGPSGAGKSALLNAVQPGHNLAEGQLSARIGRGRHTTREVRLIPLDSGGLVADSPGFSVLDIDSMKPRDLWPAFPEMRGLAPGCKFIGCVHDAEPECAVKAAVMEGRIPYSRYSHYLAILGELREAERRQYK
ncbi:MAG: ribosome small subunit-dependent GTPase A [Clostridia bacterium]|nr:ribosome small subunit-dependent GTPase A [Clostridia bacterium]